MEYLHAEANPDCSILNSSEKDQWSIEKCGDLHCGGNNLKNGASYALG